MGGERVTRFTLTVFADGQMLLSTEQTISVDEARQVREAFDRWRAEPQGVAVIAECEVQHATSIAIDLPVPA